LLLLTGKVSENGHSTPLNEQHINLNARFAKIAQRVQGLFMFPNLAENLCAFALKGTLQRKKCFFNNRTGQQWVFAHKIVSFWSKLFKKRQESPEKSPKELSVPLRMLTYQVKNQDKRLVDETSHF